MIDAYNYLSRQLFYIHMLLLSLFIARSVKPPTM